MEYAGQGQLGGAGAATGPVVAFEHRHVDALLGEADGRGQAIRPTADDDCAGHWLTPFGLTPAGT